MPATRKTHRRVTSAIALLVMTLVVASRPGTARGQDELPNVVIVFCDDQGYADLGCFGAEGFETPHIDRLAREGTRFTNFHVAQAVCSASRAALLTGCYPNRIGIHGALGPKARHGIHDDEMTLAELVKQKGYATGIFGKWHLGHHPQFLPTRHGFDEYFGLPYSNDMWPRHPTAGRSFPELPLIEGETIVEYDPDQTQLTTRYTERAVGFIEKHHERPFLLYVPHSMPHVPLFVSDKFKGKSARGIYGDVIMEIDWSVGQIVDALERRGLERRTLVIFTTDNGPWLSYGDHAGSAKPLREGKGTSWEGGVRVPCVMRWPGRIPAGRVCDTPIMTIDILPTVAGLIGGALPDHTIDGRDVWPVIAGTAGATSPQEAYAIYYASNELQAILSGRWKLYLPHGYRTLGGRPGGTGGTPVGYESARVAEPELYDLVGDIGESEDVAAAHPAVVSKLLQHAERARAELGDRLTGSKGSGVREPGRLK